MVTMTATHAGDLEPATAAERESIEAEIAGSTLLTAFAETAERLHDNFPYFHPLYAGQVLKPPHPVARAA